MQRLENVKRKTYNVQLSTAFSNVQRITYNVKPQKNANPKTSRRHLLR